MKILLKNINLIHPLEKLSKSADILISNGLIEDIGDNLKTNNDVKVFDFSGKYAAPGFVDMHVHLREPGREDEETIETGCLAAAAGGFTEIACMPNTDPALDSAEVVALIKKKAQNNLVDVHPIAAATVNRKGEVISPMGELYDAGAKGFSDDGNVIKTSSILKRALEYSLMYGTPVIEHCEDDSLLGGSMNEGFNSTLLGLNPIPSVAEDIIVMRDILMAEYTGGKIHIAHISTKRSIELVRDAKKRGVNVTAEVTPHHFTLTDDALKTYDTNYKMSPPLRSKADLDEILKGLKDGTIDVIASDHAPHSIEEKEVEFEYAPNGIIGLETEVGLTLSELYHKKVLTLEQVVEKLSINPRKILNLPIPSFKKGEKANITIFDVNEIWTVDISKQKSKSINSPFDKRLLNGNAVAAINNGKMYYKNEMVEV
ncbi:MAG TPA: dihydroorotase [Ignavibacteriaceae bacterium]|nr:dihydroorotase [Ignavibacteriaceae bacterium]